MIVRRKTVRDSVAFEGLGLHTGVPVKMTVHPGQDGIAFRLGSERVLAHPSNVTDTTRSTRVGTVGTVEHIMSAFAGLEVTDAEVELDAPEVPGMDGSAGPYVVALNEVGFTFLGEREIPALFSRVFLQEDAIKLAIAKGEGWWRYTYDLGARWPGEMSFESSLGNYAEEIATSRTFALAEEVPVLIQHGLGQGLDEHSALIIGIEGYKNEARFSDEPARHKLLDLMGDLYLAGVPVRMLDVVGERTGHRVNVKAAALLAAAVFGD